MTTRSEVKAVLLAVEKANGPIAYLDNAPAKVTREELRVLLEAANKAWYRTVQVGYDSAGPAYDYAL